MIRHRSNSRSRSSRSTYSLKSCRAGEQVSSALVRACIPHFIRNSETHLFLRAQPDRHSKDLPRRVELLLPHLELGKLDPDFGERELFVRDELETRAVDLARALQVLTGDGAETHKSVPYARGAISTVERGL